MPGTKGHSGGRRANAGRKSNPNLERARNLLNSEFSNDEWRRVLHALFDLVVEKTPHAHQSAQLLFSYMFGVPTAQNSEPKESAPFNMIVIHEPKPFELPAQPIAGELGAPSSTAVAVHEQIPDDL